MMSNEPKRPSREEKVTKKQSVVTGPLEKLGKTVKDFYKEKKDQGVASLGVYALEKFGRSKYARQHLSTVPTSIIAALLKSMINFLILYRVATGNVYVDFIISLLVTVILACLSPLFYYMAKERQNDWNKFSNHFADQLMVNGVDYLFMWRGRGIAAMGACAIGFLLIYDVDSWYLIRIIIELLVSFWVVDQVNLLRESIFKPIPILVREEFLQKARAIQLTQHDFIKVPIGKAQVAHTVTRENVIDVYQKPLKLRHFKTREELVSHLRQELEYKRAKQAVIGGQSRRILEDWCQ